MIANCHIYCSDEDYNKPTRELYKLVSVLILPRSDSNSLSIDCLLKPLTWSTVAKTMIGSYSSEGFEWSNAPRKDHTTLSGLICRVRLTAKGPAGHTVSSGGDAQGLGGGD